MQMSLPCFDAFGWMTGRACIESCCDNSKSPLLGTRFT